MASSSSTNERRRKLGLGLAGVIVALVFWGLWLHAPAGHLPSPEEAIALKAAPSSRPSQTATIQPGLEYAADGLPVMPADPRAARPAGPVHPHPHTPAHERIYRENNLVGALNLAVDRQDPTRIREVLATYRTEYPEDDHVLQEGYAIIADCLERLDAPTRTRAESFWRTQIRSQTRRYVRRHCLTP